jgi:hypothetical protein
VIKNLTEDESSEINKNNWTVSSFLELLSDILIPKLPISSPSWIPKIIQRIFFGGNSKYIADKEEVKDKICFIYINGILSNRNVIEQNKKAIKVLFNRPVNLIHNVTDSFIMDIIECIIGKETDDMTEPSTVALAALSRKLLDPEIKKVVVICHSQGTIIIGKVLNNLKILGLDRNEFIKKLEIYAFANCSSNMVYVKEKYPYIESFANDNDIVARLGCNCNNKVKKYIKIDGPVFIKENKSGHMFNSHYINNFQNDFPNSKLNQYIN